MLEAARARATWKQRFRAALGSLLAFLDRESAIGVALLVEVHAAGPRAARKRIEVMRRLATLANPAAAEDSGDGTSTVTADGLVGGIDSAIRNRLRDQTGWECTELLPELMYFAVLAFEGPEAAVAELERVGASG